MKNAPSGAAAHQRARACVPLLAAFQRALPAPSWVSDRSLTHAPSPTPSAPTRAVHAPAVRRCLALMICHVMLWVQCVHTDRRFACLLSCSRIICGWRKTHSAVRRRTQTPPVRKIAFTFTGTDHTSRETESMFSVSARVGVWASTRVRERELGLGL